MLSGRIQVASIVSVSRAYAVNGKASRHDRADVVGLTIDGVSVKVSPGAVFDVPGVGQLIVDEHVDTVRTEGERSTATNGIRLHFTTAVGDAAEGTDVIIGATEAESQAGGTDTAAFATTPQDGAERALAAVAPTAVTPAVVTPVALPTVAAAVPVAAPAPPAVDLFDTSRTQDPSPGGYTRTPPVDESMRARLLSSEYVFPVVGHADYSNDYGGPRADVAAGFHQGIDMFASRGTPVVAVHDGTVFKVGWNRLGGNRLWLADTNGNLFYYAHLEGYAEIAKDGAQVRAGEVIGFMGNTGDASTTPVHLHFEIHPNGLWSVPPIEYVSLWERTGSPLLQPLTPVTAGNIDPQSLALAATPAPDQVAGPLPDAIAADAPGVEMVESVDIASAAALDDAAIAAAAAPELP